MANYLKLNGDEYPVIFDMDGIEWLCSKYNLPISSMQEALVKITFDDLRHILHMGLRAGFNEEGKAFNMKKEEVKPLIRNPKDFTAAMMAFTKSMTFDLGEEEEEEKK